ncbi:hypothetical protein LJ655_14750 [Paraburkholderia sp. MMS20-SJTN17]|uniref:Tetratricopeptide repeat protein n=1 Tax=Paraburkholderia translucens TaxID=2886945 RepID=A0ABS8KEE1_9BURK|nr:hypothetical protein [Paraburkholderia sp. MMS20-SJTN17]MCC8403132.1 hypothetical protein [Paraburkholderia sp. MMS20-SJTN17]
MKALYASLVVAMLMAGAVSAESPAQSARSPQPAPPPVAVGQVATAQNGHAINVSGTNNFVKVSGELDEKTRAQLEAAVRNGQQTQRMLADVRVEYKKALATIQRLADQMNAAPRAKEAAQALAAGNSAPSEALLHDEEQGVINSAEGQTAPTEQRHKEAAELARQRGALAFWTDKTAALDAYLTAVSYDPADVKTRIFTGDLQNLLGDTSAARETFAKALSVAEANLRKYPDNARATRELALSMDRVGESIKQQGDLQGAIARYQQALALLAPLAKAAPDDVPLQLDFAESHASLGSALRARGDSNALAQFQAAIAITEPLLRRYPDDIEVQLTTAANHFRAGRILESAGNLSGALNEYRQARTIAESQSTRQKTQAAKGDDVTIGHHNADVIRLAANDACGVVLLMQGDRAGALDAFEEGLRISQELAQQDPGNDDWQLCAAGDLTQIGTLHMLQGRPQVALTELKKAGNIYSAMAQKDPTNVERQVGAALTHFGSTAPLLMTGDRAGAAAEAKLAVSELETLTQRSPDDTQWRAMLAQAYIFEVSARNPADPPDPARQQLDKAAAILRALLAHDPANTDWRAALAECRTIEAQLLLQSGDAAGAVSASKEGIGIYEQLVKEDPTAVLDMLMLAESSFTLSMAMQAKGERDAAKDMLARAMDGFQKVLKTDPDNSMAAVLLAIGYLTLGRQSSQPEQQRAYFLQGSSIVKSLKERGELADGFSDLIPTFDGELAALAAR